MDNLKEEYEEKDRVLLILNLKGDEYKKGFLLEGLDSDGILEKMAGLGDKLVKTINVVKGISEDE